MEDEVPSSATTVTISQTLIALSNCPAATNMTKKEEDSSAELCGGGANLKSTRPNQDHRAALFDISNDSPIVGLAKGSAFSNGRKNLTSCTWNKTPGSGEALLRRQVKTLLQRVEEEAVISKFILDTTDSDGSREEKRPSTCSVLKNFLYSPMGILAAPTPANTPQENDGGESNLVKVENYVVDYQIAECDISQVADDSLDCKKGNNETALGSEKCMVTRSLLSDFSEKSYISTPTDATISCSSSPIYLGYESSSKVSCCSSTNSSSIWSIQVNVSTQGDEDNEVEREEDGDAYGKEDEDCLVSDVCEGMNRISVTHAAGKHTRFVYNSDDEIVGENQEDDA